MTGAVASNSAKIDLWWCPNLILSWGFWGVLDIVFVDDVSHEHLRPVLYICTVEVGIARVFLPSCCKKSVESVDGSVVLLSYTVVPCSHDVPAVVGEGGAAYDR